MAGELDIKFSREPHMQAGCLPVLTSGIKNLLHGSRSRTPISREDIPLLEAHLQDNADPKQSSSSDGLKHLRGTSLPNLPDQGKISTAYESTSKDCSVQNTLDGNTTTCHDSSNKGEHFLHSPVSPALRRPVNRLLSSDTEYGDSGYSTPGVFYEFLPGFNRQNSCLSDKSEGIYEKLPEFPVTLRRKENPIQNTSLQPDLPSTVLQGPTQTLVTERMFSDINEDLACGESWKKVGRYMFSNAVVQNIDADYSSNAEKAFQLLIRWLQEKGSQATVERLAAILRKADRVDVAEKLERLSKKVWRQSLELIEEQGRQPELVDQLQNYVKTLQDSLSQRHFELNEMYKRYQEREVYHKATELELKELQRLCDYHTKLSPKYVEMLLQRMHRVEEELKDGKRKNKKGRDYENNEGHDDVQSQCMSGFMNNIKRRLPSTASGRKKQYTPSKKITKTDGNRRMRDSYLFALDGPPPYDKLPTEPPVTGVEKTTSKNTYQPPIHRLPPPPYHPPQQHSLHHSKSVPCDLSKASYDDHALHRQNTAPTRSLTNHPQGEGEVIKATSLEGEGENQKTSSKSGAPAKMINWMQGQDEARDAVTV